MAAADTKDRQAELAALRRDIDAMQARIDNLKAQVGEPSAGTHEVMRAMTLESGPVMPGDVITLDNPTHVRTLEGSGYVRALGPDRLTYAQRAALRPTNNVAVRHVDAITAAGNAALEAINADASKTPVPAESRTAAENISLAAGEDTEAALAQINEARAEAGLPPQERLPDASEPGPGTTEQTVADALGTEANVEPPPAEKPKSAARSSSRSR